MSGQSLSTLTVTQVLIVALLRPVSYHDRARAAVCALDWTGCALAGAATDTGRAFRRHVEAAPSGAAALIGGGGSSPLSAAYFNGALGNILEMDDVDKRAILHPGPCVVPALLAALALPEVARLERAERTRRFLDALVVGYEAVIRLGRAVGPAHYQFWHSTSTCGSFGAAAGVAHLLGLDQEARADALGLAVSLTGGLWQTRHEPGSFAKQAHTGRAAQAGLDAALLARHGVAGPRAILEGPQGLFAATCGGADPRGVVDFPATAPWTLHDVSIKPWPACRHAHAAIDAALIARAHGVRPGDVAAVEAVSYGDAVRFCDKPDPRTEIEAKFSLQHAVAVALMDGPPGFDAFSLERLKDAPTSDLRARVQVEAGAPYAAAYPARYGAGLTLTLQDGRRLEVSAPDALGDPENPLAPEAIEAKARTLMTRAGVVAERADAVIRAARGLGESQVEIDDYLDAVSAALIPGAPS